MRKTFLLVLTGTFLLISCVSNSGKKVPDLSETTGFKIPFTLDSHHHVILTFVTDENQTVHFNFDSGCPDKKSLVSEEGFKKLSGSSYDDLMKQRENFPATATTDFSPAFLTVKTSMGEIRFAEKVFSYSPAEINGYEASDDIDATVGFAFFSEAKRITFNYKESFIEIDGPAISEASIPLHYFKATGHYFAPVTIDGKDDYALLDTGSEVFTLRESAFSRKIMCSMMEDQNLSFSDFYTVISQVKLQETEDEYNRAKSFTLGNVTWENVRALKITDCHMHTGALSRQIIASSNNIGYPFFKDKIIQFDLEKMIFRICE